jgi:hypothetical protein
MVPHLGGPAVLLLLLAPIHLYAHMRGVYGTGVFGTLWRMLVLFVLSSIALGVMMLAVLVIGLNEMEGAAEARAPASAQGAPAKLSAPAAPKLKLD